MAQEINGTIAVGGTAQALTDGLQPLRSYSIQNTSTSDMWVSEAQTPGLNAGWLLPPGATAEEDRPQGSVLQVWCATTGATFVARVY